jgi:DNA invertase Pin-like site-specific DNA recombinase
VNYIDLPIEQFRQLRQQNKTYDEICEALYISRTTLWRLMKKYELQDKKHFDKDGIRLPHKKNR